jgi:DHA1 family multidrug resistance protein-like MFS transporter
MWLSGFCFVFLFFLLPETSSTNILYRRTRRMRKISGDSRLTCEPEIMSENMTGKDIVFMVLVRPITLNFTEPMVFLLNLYIALIYGLVRNFSLKGASWRGFVKCDPHGLRFAGHAKSILPLPPSL